MHTIGYQSYNPMEEVEEVEVMEEEVVDMEVVDLCYGGGSGYGGGGGGSGHGGGGGGGRYGGGGYVQNSQGFTSPGMSPSVGKGVSY